MAKSRITCSVDGCNKPSIARGWCHAHYKRWQTTGSLMADVEILIKDGQPLRFLNEMAIKHSGQDCLIWPFARAGGRYGQITIDGKTHYVHRLVCEAVHGPAPSAKHQAAHTCGSGYQGCVNPQHLSWKTRRENEADKLSHGTRPLGERHWGAKVTEDDVRAIRSLAGSLSQKQVGLKFGVSAATVSAIQRRKRWAWLV